MPVIYWHFNECLSAQNIIANMERMLGCAAKMRWIGWEHVSGQKERASTFWIQSAKCSDSHKNFTQGCWRYAWTTRIYDNRIKKPVYLHMFFFLYWGHYRKPQQFYRLCCSLQMWLPTNSNMLISAMQTFEISELLTHTRINHIYRCSLDAVDLAANQIMLVLV